MFFFFIFLFLFQATATLSRKNALKGGACIAAGGRNDESKLRYSQK